MRTAISLLSLVAWGCQMAVASDESDDAPPVPSQNRLEQLQNCRDGIVDPQARPEERRRWINQLLAFDTPASRELVTDLLGLQNRSEIQQAICEVLGVQASAAPHRLAAEFVDPLVGLLGSSQDSLRRAAVSALARFPHPEATNQLCSLAGDAKASTPTRLAAIDALASKVDRREVVDALVSQLDADMPAITDRVIAALRPLTNEDFDNDVTRWRAWWSEKSKLGAEAWLADQLQIYRDRLRRIRDEYDAYRAAASQRHEALAAKLGEFQRDYFRSINTVDQNSRLVAWLNDPLEEVNRTSLGLIRARIADEGRRPEGEVLSALLARMKTGTPGIRRDVLLIVQTLDDPTVIDAVLAQLAIESDTQTRQAILRAVGRLNDAKALPALVAEVSAQASDACVREAAIAIGHIATGLEERESLKDAVPAIKNRYQSLAADDATSKAALLSAMAGMADPQFADEFLAAIESDDVDILRPAIRGLRAIRNHSKTTRMRALSAHADPLIRLAAVEALGELAAEDVDLESLLTRLNPSIESSDTVRDAAWRSVRGLLAVKPVAEQIEAAARLREVPELEIAFLTDLAQRLSPNNGHATDLDMVYDRLGTLQFVTGRYADAAKNLRSLYEVRAAIPTKERVSAGIRWLDALLRIPGYPQLGDGIDYLARSFAKESRPRIVDTVNAYVDSLPQASTGDQHARLEEELRSVPVELLGPEWGLLLGKLDERTASESALPLDRAMP